MPRVKRSVHALAALFLAILRCELCRDEIAHFKCPKSVDFMEELPKSGAGKILKRDLRKAFWGEGRQVG